MIRISNIIYTSSFVDPRFMDPRFVDKTRFVDGFLGHEKSTNRVRQGFKEKRNIFGFQLNGIFGFQFGSV